MPDLVAEPDEKQVEKEQRSTGAMSLLQHLEELRKRIIFSAGSVAVCFGVGWWQSERIFNEMRKPIVVALTNNKMDPALFFKNPTDPFNLFLKIGLIAGIFMACPVILYQVWMFISPGLYRREKRFALPFLFMSVGLFVTGGLFGFKIVFPVALDFLIQQGAHAGMKSVIMVDEYTDLFLTIMLGLALIFELPIVLGFAGMMGVVSAKFLFKHIRGAVLICFVIAAILTPTTDMMNMTIYAAPMILLYILSIGIVWLVHPRQRRKRAEKRDEKQK
jgi:sec-independent protein translocase protein TatC